ncbi:GNAT family N-acetyltransferase [Pontibacter akesuensis]|uniref:Acetyltransferase (GNAT) domain-containing protein n=1 Tax=Pontibacter akesuensis TaxID=388950 RepID=A0A1I7I2C2_9BACT|nr:GNAT family N-acetyltransferase [Pontibacter akesuensis]GHA64838.1 N-acetyltransferase [Pontibacter akesuensis]SFU67092.1 Acetyltransferase (GNAT) domain-containing protein [Pontibacter akesuensis]
MEHIRLTDASHRLFEKAWALYEQAFPLEERRPLPWQAEVMAHVDYHFELILQNEELVGILLWWGFEDVRFLEHFATAPALRGKGYGSRMLLDFLNRDARPVLLEVEPPESEVNRRRITFYEQTGFCLNQHFYQQPPYHQGQQPLTLLLMSYPNPITAEETATFVRLHHPLIYRTGL